MKRSATSIGADEAFNLGIFANTGIKVLVDPAIGPGHGFEVEWPSFNNLYERKRKDEQIWNCIEACLWRHGDKDVGSSAHVYLLLH